MSMRVAEIKAWLNTLDDDDLVGIHEKDMCLTLADEQYGDDWLEIGMALSSDFLNQNAAE